MKVTATTVSYDGIPKVVMLEFSGQDVEHQRYVMKPEEWKSDLRPVLMARPDVIVELAYRDATPDECAQVEEVAKQIRDMAFDGSTESSIE